MQQTPDMDGPSNQARANPSEPIGLVREGSTPTEPVEAQAQSQGPIPGLPSWVPTGIAVFGFVVLFYTVIRSLRRNAARRKKAPQAAPKERIEHIRTHAAQRDLIEGYSSDAIELTQRLAAQLDTKAERLEQLIARAERAIEGLAPGEPAGPRLVRPDGTEGPSTMPPLHRKIYALADQGHDVLSIAQQLEQPQGQIELVLALRRG